MIYCTSGIIYITSVTDTFLYACHMYIYFCSQIKITICTNSCDLNNVIIVIYLCIQCRSPLMRVPISIRTRCTTLCDKVCQWLATCGWFSLGRPVSSTNKTDRHDLTEILLKVALNTIKQTTLTNKKSHVIFLYTCFHRYCCLWCNIIYFYFVDLDHTADVQ